MALIGEIKKLKSFYPLPPPLTKNLSNHPLKNLSLNGLQVSSAVKNVPYNLYHGGMWKGFGLRKCSQLEEKPFETNSPFIKFFPDHPFLSLSRSNKSKTGEFSINVRFHIIGGYIRKINLIIKKWFFSKITQVILKGSIGFVSNLP